MIVKKIPILAKDVIFFKIALSSEISPKKPVQKRKDSIFESIKEEEDRILENSEFGIKQATVKRGGTKEFKKEILEGNKTEFKFNDYPISVPKKASNLNLFNFNENENLLTVGEPEISQPVLNNPQVILTNIVFGIWNKIPRRSKKRRKVAIFGQSIFLLIIGRII